MFTQFEKKIEHSRKKVSHYESIAQYCLTEKQTKNYIYERKISDSTWKHLLSIKYLKYF